MTQLQQKLNRFQNGTVTLVYFIIKLTFSLLIGFLTSKSSLLDDFSPFSIILLSVVKSLGLNVSACYIGSTVGYLSNVIDLSVFKYITALTMIYVIQMIFHKNTLKEDRSVLSGAVCFVSGFLFLLADGITLFKVLLLIGESILISCCIYFLNYAIEGFKRNTLLTYRELIAASVALMLILATLHNVEIFHLNLSRTVALIVLFMAMEHLKISIVVLLSSCLGIVMAVVGNGGETIFTAFIVAGLSSSVFLHYSGRFSKVVFMVIYYAILFFFDKFPWSYWYFAEPAVAYGLVRLLPHRKIRAFLAEYIPVRPKLGSKGKEEPNKFDELTEQLNEISQKLGEELNEATALTILSKEEELIKITMAEAGLCVKEINFTSIGDKNRQCTGIVEQNEDVLCENIIKRCLEPHFNSTPSTRFKSVGTDIHFIASEPTPYLINCAAVCKTKNGEDFCGDNALGFSPDRERYCLVLTDGMGSGKKACVHSSLAIESIKKYTVGGLSMLQAINVFRSAQRLTDEQCFTTVDVCEIDKNTGRATFYKAGSFDSYLLHEKEISVISGGGMPIGLSERDKIRHCSIQLSKGDYIIMGSDGLSQFGDRITENILCCKDPDPRKFAEKILRKLSEYAPFGSDDVTVIVCRIDSTEE